MPAMVIRQLCVCVRAGAWACVFMSVFPVQRSHRLSFAQWENLATIYCFTSPILRLSCFWLRYLLPDKTLIFLLYAFSLTSELLLFSSFAEIKRENINNIAIVTHVQLVCSANQQSSWEKHRGMQARCWLLELENQLYCPPEIKVSVKAALSSDGDKSSSSRHSGAEFSSPQPFLKERLISHSIACCATSQAGMHRVVSLTPARWVKKKLGSEKERVRESGRLNHDLCFARGCALGIRLRHR